MEAYRKFIDIIVKPDYTVEYKEITVKVKHNPYVVKIHVEGDMKKKRELATTKIEYRLEHPDVKSCRGRRKIYQSVKERNHAYYKRTHPNCREMLRTAPLITCSA